ncbi:hypothetical protein I4U23_027748 [Adineta vaga]|nr:hypothetical protein I4U23_027748 [Adineta vaga]
MYSPTLIKILLILILFIIYLLYIFRETLFLSSSCTHFYNENSFHTCALSTKTCNITLLINSYILYRNCILNLSFPHANYVIFDAVNGLGNRILGFISTLTYALVTNRVLLINWQPGDNHETYFQELFLPLSLSSLENEKISFSYQYSLSRLMNLIKNRWMNEIEWKTKINSRIPRDWAFYFDREILCDEKMIDNRSWFEQFGFYIMNLFANHNKWIRTDQYFVPLLTRNQRLRESFQLLFHNGQIFNELARRFLQPIPKVNSIVEDFNRKYDFQKRNITIGVHMRSWSSHITNHIEPFQKCIQHIIENITQSHQEQIKIHLYVISNTPRRRQNLINEILNNYKNIEILHPFEVSNITNAIEKMQYTLAELLILSKMKHLIITSKSTFGMVAQGFARKGAWIVRQGASNEMQSFESDLCQWESTSEPEYQMMNSFLFNNSCLQNEGVMPSIGERIN